jgi:hypothetical protein
MESLNLIKRRRKVKNKYLNIYISINLGHIYISINLGHIYISINLGHIYISINLNTQFLKSLNTFLLFIS